jgi:hypothetical protein
MSMVCQLLTAQCVNLSALDLLMYTLKGTEISEQK